MRTWGLLLGAILTEVTATLSLRASQDHLMWLGVVLAGYLASFILLTRVLRAGMPVRVAYGIWGLGAASQRSPRLAVRRSVHRSDRGGNQPDHRRGPARRVRVAPHRRSGG